MLVVVGNTWKGLALNGSGMMCLFAAHSLFRIYCGDRAGVKLDNFDSPGFNLSPLRVLNTI